MLLQTLGKFLAFGVGGGVLGVVAAVVGATHCKTMLAKKCCRSCG